MVCNPHVCGFYSFTGTVFMLFVYVMLGSQPFFISGIDDVDTAKRNAFGALLTFVVTFLISMYFIWKSANDAGKNGKEGGDKDLNRLNIDLKKSYGAVHTDSY